MQGLLRAHQEAGNLSSLGTPAFTGGRALASSQRGKREGTALSHARDVERQPSSCSSPCGEHHRHTTCRTLHVMHNNPASTALRSTTTAPRFLSGCTHYRYQAPGGPTPLPSLPGPSSLAPGSSLLPRSTATSSLRSATDAHVPLILILHVYTPLSVHRCKHPLGLTRLLGLRPRAGSCGLPPE